MSTLKNPKHERFAQQLAAGRSQVEAYELAGFAGSPRRNASNTLARNPPIGQRVAELMQEKSRIEQDATKIAARKVAVDKAWVMEKLVDVVTQCLPGDAALTRSALIGDGITGDRPRRVNPAGATRALELLGRELGMFVERRETRDTSYNARIDAMSTEELEEEIEKYAKLWANRPRPNRVPTDSK